MVRFFDAQAQYPVAKSVQPFGRWQARRICAEAEPLEDLAVARYGGQAQDAIGELDCRTVRIASYMSYFVDHAKPVTFSARP